MESVIENKYATTTAYALGALALAGEAAVHVQQFVLIFHAVPWIGPLFLGNAAAALAVMAGLAYAPTRRLAALAGILVSALALAGLVVSYGQGLFGWQEVGFRGPVVIALVSELAAVALLSVALVGRR